MHDNNDGHTLLSIDPWQELAQLNNKYVSCQRQCSNQILERRKICVFLWVNLDSFPQKLHCGNQEEKVE